MNDEQIFNMLRGLPGVKCTYCFSTRYNDTSLKYCGMQLATCTTLLKRGKETKREYLITKKGIALSEGKDIYNITNN